MSTTDSPFIQTEPQENKCSFFNESIVLRCVFVVLIILVVFHLYYKYYYQADDPCKDGFVQTTMKTGLETDSSLNVEHEINMLNDIQNGNFK